MTKWELIQDGESVRIVDDTNGKTSINMIGEATVEQRLERGWYEVIETVPSLVEYERLDEPPTREVDEVAGTVTYTWTKSRYPLNGYKNAKRALLDDSARFAFQLAAASNASGLPAGEFALAVALGLTGFDLEGNLVTGVKDATQAVLTARQSKLQAINNASTHEEVLAVDLTF